MYEISTYDLQRRLDGNDDLVLVDVSGRRSFAARHIPGAVCAPVDEAGFVQSVRAATGGECSRSIVLYGADSTSDGPARAAQLLADAGFRQVATYRAGLAGWAATGREVEAARRSRL